MTNEYDLVVVGAGSGGMAAAKKAASRGYQVAIVEERTFGGTCVARGCMPKKFLFIAAKKMRQSTTKGPNGFRMKPEDLDWAQLINHQQTIVNELISSNQENAQDYDNIQIYEGHATLTGNKEISVDEDTICYDKLIIATGMSPNRPPIKGEQHGITSDQFLTDHDLPHLMTIVGGGYIAVEFASILNAFGVDVKIFQRPDQLLADYDRDIADNLQEEMQEKGIKIHTNSEVVGIEKTGQAYRVTVESDNRSFSHSSDRVLLATGRKPNTENMNLKNRGIELKNGFVEVDETFRTSADDVYAVGDVTGEMPFTPVAILEGKRAAVNALESKNRRIDYEYIPTAVFSQPQIGSVGYSESEAREKFGSLEVARNNFKPFEYAVRKEQGQVYIKLIYSESDNRLVGLHVLGPGASEIVQGFSPAMKKGLSQDDLKDFPGIHPTIAEEVFSTKPSS